MIKTIETSQSVWNIEPGDDPRFVRCAERLVAASAVLGRQRRITVVRIDNWFGRRWLGWGKRIFRVRRRRDHVYNITKMRDPDWPVPSFHPNRVISEQHFELREDGVIVGPCESSRSLHRQYTERIRELFFRQSCEPGVYAWCSGNTTTNDRAALMVYTHNAERTSGWYVEFRKSDDWKLSQRTCIGDADWHLLLEIGGITELE